MEYSETSLIATKLGFICISILSSSCVILSMIILGRFDRHVVDRMTLRMQTAIAAFNITHHILEVVAFTGVLCRAASGALVATDLVYYSLNIALSANMQLMFLNERLPSAKWEWRYWTVALTLPALVSIAALATGIVERDQSGLCGIAPNLSKIITFVIRPATMIYCITIPIYILAKLHFQKDAFVKLKRYLSRKTDIQAEEFKGKLSWVLYRSSLCPLACAAVISGGLVYDIIYFISNMRPCWAVWLSMGASSLVGLFNFVAFLMNPAVIRGYAKYLTFRFHGEVISLNHPDAGLNSRRPVVHFSELQ